MTISDPAKILATIPSGLRKPLLAAYAEIVNNFIQERWEPSELNGGKLCEIVYTILRGHVDGKFASKPQKPKNMVDACKGLENAGNAFTRSVRIQIPRMLIALYEIRNNRGVGHAGGDVDPNHMDAVTVLAMSKWIMAELVRIFHNITTADATAIVDVLVERLTPVVWRVGDTMRVLDHKLGMPDKTLLLLYHCPRGASERDMFSWVEHSNASVYRRDVLRTLHKGRMLEFTEGHLTISPKGVRYVEENFDLSL